MGLPFRPVTHQNRMPAAQAAALIATSTALALCAIAGVLDPAPSTVAMYTALAFVPYGVVVSSHFKVSGTPVSNTPTHPASLGGWWLAILVPGLALAFTPPVLSDDLYRFLWDGHVGNAGIPPYRFAPNAPELAHLRSTFGFEHWQQINHPELSTIYPPFAQVWFRLVNLVGGHIWIWKLLTLSAHLGVTALLLRTTSPKPALLFGLNPLALVESAGSGHLDTALGGLLLLGALLVAKQRPFRVGTALGALSGLKLLGPLGLVALLPNRNQTHHSMGKGKSLVLLAAVLTVTGLCTWPLIQTSQSNSGGLGNYATRWQGNGVAFGFIETKLRHRFYQASRHTEHPMQLRVPWISSSELYPTRKLASVTARLVVLTWMLLWLGLLAVRAWRSPNPIAPPHLLHAALWGILPALPQIHPWYLLWLLPLDLARDTGSHPRLAATLWTAAWLATYATADTWHWLRQAQEPTTFLALTQITVLLVALWESARSTCTSSPNPYTQRSV